MIKFARMAALAAAATLAVPAVAAPVGVPVGQEPVATARIIKPLTLTSTGSLDFGTIVMNGVTANRLIRLDASTGAISAANCGGGSAEVVCSGATSVPTYNVKGTQGQTVTVTKSTSSLTGSNGGSLTLTPTGANTVLLSNSGVVGNDFNIGGDITIGAATVDGVYTGTVNVTVDY